MDNAILIALAIAGLVAGVLYVRLAFVYIFSLDLTNDAYNFDIRTDFEEKMKFARHICEKNSWSKYMLLMKPLKYKYWFNESEIQFLTKHELPKCTCGNETGAYFVDVI